MSVQQVIDGLKERIGEDCGLDAVLKFDFGETGCVTLDATQVPNRISSDDLESHCTMEISLEHFLQMASGELDGMSALMAGKLKVQGDMSLAMKLGPMLA